MQAEKVVMPFDGKFNIKGGLLSDFSCCEASKGQKRPIEVFNQLLFNKSGSYKRKNLKNQMCEIL